MLERGWVFKEIKKRGLLSQSKAIYADLHRLLAMGIFPNALLPDSHLRGGPGKERNAKRKLGRPALIDKKNGTAATGYVMDAVVKSKIKSAYDALHMDDASIRETYLRYCQIYHAESKTIVEGRESIVLRDASDRPTERQFYYWAIKGDERMHASRRAQGDDDWEKNSRPLPGTVQDGIRSIGNTAQCDATSSDVYALSETSRLITVGIPFRIVVKEVMVLGYVTGFYHGLAAPSGDTALAAILNAATPKKEYCARYGIKIEDDDWPHLTYRSYLVDRGEFKNKQTEDATKMFNSGVELAKTGASDRKGSVESQHHTDHKQLDHKLPGTTHGRQRKRGEKPPADSAVFTTFELTREYIRHILRKNLLEDVSHLLTTEMRRDNVKPYRSAIVRWHRDNGRIEPQECDYQKLNSILLPQVPSVITAKGLLILRNDRQAKREFVHGARFVSEELVQSGLMERARVSGNIPTFVRMSHEDLSIAWLFHGTQLFKLRNVDSDYLRVGKMTYEDCCAVQDNDLIQQSCSKSGLDQADADYLLGRDTNIALAKAMKLDEEKVAVDEKKPKHKKTKNSIRKAKNAEMEREALQAANTRPTKPVASIAPLPKLQGTQPLTRAQQKIRASLESQ